MSVLLKNLILRLLKRTFDANPPFPFVLDNQLFFSLDELQLSIRSRQEVAGLPKSTETSIATALCLKDCKYNHVENVDHIVKEILSFLHESQSTFYFCVFTSVAKKELSRVLPGTFRVRRLTLQFLRVCRQSLTDPELQSLMEKCLIGVLDLYVVLFSTQGQEFLTRKLLLCIQELNKENLFRFKFDSVSLKLPQENMILVKSAEKCVKKLSVDDVIVVELSTVDSNLPTSFSNGLFFHTSIYRKCSNIGAIIHAYPDNASSLSCLGKPILSFHALCRSMGPSPIMCAKYESFGTPEFVNGVLSCLVDGRLACLVVNQGLVVVGQNLDAVSVSCKQLIFSLNKFCNMLLLHRFL